MCCHLYSQLFSYSSLLYCSWVVLQWTAFICHGRLYLFYSSSWYKVIFLTSIVRSFIFIYLWHLGDIRCLFWADRSKKCIARWWDMSLGSKANHFWGWNLCVQYEWRWKLDLQDIFIHVSWFLHQNINVRVNIFSWHLGRYLAISTKLHFSVDNS